MLKFPAPSAAPAVPFLAALARHIDNHKTANVDWPADAVYAVEYTLKAWPCAATSHIRFFATKELLEQWYASQLKWAREEDNYYETTGLWFWDLGPNYIPYQDWALYLTPQQ